MHVNVVRDVLATNDREASAWDRWREAPPAARAVTQQELPALDALARDPEARPGDLMPSWLVGAG